jgi:hypothetical protein
MDKFSDCYAKARKVVNNDTYADDWKTIQEDLKTLLGKRGPDADEETVLSTLRAKLAEAKKKGKSEEAVAEAIILASKQGKKDIAGRAATLKMMKHFYLGRKSGGQKVWIYAPPKDYSAWIFDEITGTETEMKGRLVKESEVYTATNRRMMCDALQLARKWSMDALDKLAKAQAPTKRIVKRWFADESTTDKQLDAAISKLKDGFKKISYVCNSTRLIFSDEPIDRNGGGWKDWAFVYKKEGLSVVYLQNAFLKAGRKKKDGTTPKLWKCALTIIHELSHREVNTDDVRYDDDGLKPSKATMPMSKALKNADSWGYFGTDLAGMLSQTDRNTVLV